jgi:3-oxoacyl-[acyl-carrier protein] reductase
MPRPIIARHGGLPLTMLGVMNGLHEHVALVTGGSRGIGAAIARRLGEHGAHIALTYHRNGDQAAAMASSIKDMGRQSVMIEADNSDVDAVTDAVDQVAEFFGRLDIIVNNAGVYLVGPLEDLDPTAFDQTIAVNVRAPYVISRAAARHMTNGGRIISIGSCVAGRTVFPGYTLYSLSKTALIGMTKGLARELGTREITVNLVNPGPTDTDLNPADGPHAQAISELTALGRFAAPDEVAAVVAFLAGEQGAYVTGATINVDGGFNV